MRASGSLPALLPPVFAEGGRMLVDGAVIDNIPLRPMKALQAGPNLVVHFGTRAMPQRFEVDYASIPGRWVSAHAHAVRPRRLPDVLRPVNCFSVPRRHNFGFVTPGRRSGLTVRFPGANP